MFPARAGMNRDNDEVAEHKINVPCTRGDEPHVVAFERFNTVMFPARAGMNRTR